MKKCRICKIEKELKEFYKDVSRKDGFSYECKECKNIYYINNKQKILQQKKTYYINNKEKITAANTAWIKNNHEKCKESHKKHIENNKIKNSTSPSLINEKICSKCGLFKNIEDYSLDKRTHDGFRTYCKACVLNCSKQYRGNNKNKIKQTKAKFYQNNKTKIQKYNNKYRRNKYKSDICFRLRDIISKMIMRGLKNQNASKNNKSFKQFLPYTIEELKYHLELLFEPWMNWNNQGKYLVEDWNDNDPFTWKWQIDHIIPHSTFKYENMECEEFNKCWSLSNLRPLSAKQNWLDGVNRTRHSVRK